MTEAKLENLKNLFTQVIGIRVDCSGDDIDDCEIELDEESVMFITNLVLSSEPQPQAAEKATVETRGYFIPMPEEPDSLEKLARDIADKEIIYDWFAEFKNRARKLLEEK